MPSKNALRRNSITFALLTSLLAIPGAARSADDLAARAAAASDPEYRAAYSSAQQGAALAGDCNDKPYASREEFTSCQEQAAQRNGASASSTSRVVLTAAAPRSE